MLGGGSRGGRGTSVMCIEVISDQGISDKHTVESSSMSSE